jgi:Fe-S cluster assembly iron-binding protein IscA
MVVVTERAKEHLKKILSEHVDMPQAGIRLVDRGEGNLGIGIDVENDGDKVIEFQGSKVLMIEHNLDDQLKGITMDVEYAADGTQLVLIEK